MSISKEEFLKVYGALERMEELIDITEECHSWDDDFVITRIGYTSKDIKDAVWAISQAWGEAVYLLEEAISEKENQEQEN